MRPLVITLALACSALAQSTPIRNLTLQGTLNGAPTGGTLNLGGVTVQNIDGSAIGSGTISAARLGLGSNVQAFDSDLSALAILATGANKLPYFTGPGAAALTDLTTAGPTLLDDADAAAQRTTLGASTVGSALFTASNPGAVRYIRINADNTITMRSAAEMMSDLGGGGGVATDPIWDGVGDLVVGTGANTAGKLSRGGPLSWLRVKEDNSGLEWASIHDLREVTIFTDLGSEQQGLLIDYDDTGMSGANPLKIEVADAFNGYTFYIRNSQSDADLFAVDHTGTVYAFGYFGSGALLSELNATSLETGTVPNARLDADLQLFADLPASNNVYAARAGLQVQKDMDAWRTWRHFSVQHTRNPVQGIPDGLSGVTYNIRSGTLFGVRNQSGAAGHIYEMTRDGNVVRTITNSGFIDTESIEYVTSIVMDGAGQTGTLYDVFIVAEEDGTGANGNDEARLTICLLTTSTTTLTRTDNNGADPDNQSYLTAYTGTGAGTPGLGNLSVETLIYDQRRGRVYYTPEKRTQSNADNVTWDGNNGDGTTDAAKIFQRDVTVSTAGISLGTESQLCSILPLFTGATLTDISDGTYDTQTDTLILLSDESKKCVRIDLAGNLIEQLGNSATQPEGVAFASDSKAMWIVGEVSEFCRYAVSDHEMDTGPVKAYAMSVDATTNSSTTGVEITEIQAPLQAGTYSFKYVIRYQSAATTTGVKFGVNFSGTTSTFMATGYFAGTGTSDATAAASQAIAGATGNIMEVTSTRSKSTTSPNLGTTISVDTANADLLYIIEGLLIAATSGNLELWHASEVSAASTVKAGSMVIVTRAH